MSKAEEIIQDYAANTWLIDRLIQGLTHEESLLQPPFPANCMNWVLGHVLVSRNESIQLCGGEMWPQATIDRYKTDSPPVHDGDEDIRYFDDLCDDLQVSQQVLTDLLNNLDDAFLNEVVETRRGFKPRWQHMSGLHWHETFHMGQFDMLRSFILSLRQSGENL